LPYGSEAAALRFPGVERAEPVLRVNAPIVTADGRSPGRSTSPRVAMLFDGHATLDGVAVVAGREPHGMAEGVLDEVTAAGTGVSLGDSIGLSTSGGVRTVTVVGLLRKRVDDDPKNSTVVGIDPAVFAAFTGATGLDGVAIKVADGVSVATVQAEIAAKLPPGTEVVTAADLAAESAASAGEFVGRFSSLLLTFAFVTVFVGGFLVANVFSITVNQRMRELGVLRALGATKRQVQNMVLAEAGAVGAVASVIGIAMGVVGASLIVRFFNGGGYGLPPTSPRLVPRTIVLALAAGPIVAMIAALAPARRASSLPPMAAIRPVLASHDGRAPLRPRAVVALLVGAAAFALSITVRPGNGLVTTLIGGGGLALVYIAVASLAAVAVSPVARLAGWPLTRAFGVVGRLATDNVTRQPRRTTATAATLMIGLSLVTVAAVFAASLRDGLTSSLNDAVKADYLINGGYQGVPKAATDALGRLDGVGVVSGFRGEPVEMLGRSVRLSGVDTATLGDVVDLGLKAGRITDLRGAEMIIAQTTADKYHLALGDRVSVRWRDGHLTDVQIVGIFERAGYVGAWAVAGSYLDENARESGANYFIGVRGRAGFDAARLRSDLDALARSYPNLEVQDRASFVASKQGRVDQFLRVITSLLLLSLLIAVVGITVAMALAVVERRRELAILRVIGMTRSQLRRSVRWEAAIVALFGALVGIGLGLPIAAGLVLAQPKTFIQRLVIPFGSLALLIGFAVVAGIVAAAIPAARAARLNPVEGVKAD
jgi:putative ABC transport system permease protein